MRSKAMRDVDRIVRAVASKHVTLTLIGESGAGKEVLARRAHELSERRRGPFVPINCAAIPETLFESEIFGHERGAFTGANERVRGRIEAADGGTLFMDEIGEMPMSMQAKLLRFLENKKFMRVGGTVKIDADVRLMFATLRPLEQETRAGRFRADLLYRIQGITLNVPSLRDRRADIGTLLDQFLSQLCARHAVRRPRITRNAKALLLQYDWPGNVRELKNVVEALCILREGRPVREIDLPENIRSRMETTPPETGATGSRVTLDLNEGLETLVRRIVERALASSRGDKIKAAAQLRVSPRTVQRYVASGKVDATGRTWMTPGPRRRRSKPPSS